MKVEISYELAAEILECAACCLGEGGGGNINTLLLEIEKEWPDLAKSFSWIYDHIRQKR